MFPSSTFYNRSIFLIIRGLMSAIPLDSDPIFCRDTIIFSAAAAVDEDDDNKLESTADITDRDRSEDASEHRQTERKRAEGI